MSQLDHFNKRRPGGWEGRGGDRRGDDKRKGGGGEGESEGGERENQNEREKEGGSSTGEKRGNVRKGTQR